MNQIEIVKELSDSFHVIDCQWEDMKEALTLCILKMTEYDINKALDLWHTLLIRNKRKLNNEEVAKELVEVLFCKISSSLYKDSFDNSTEELFIIEKMTPLMQNKIEMLDIIYGDTYCGGIGRYSWEQHFLYCFVGMILHGDTDIIKRIFAKLCGNKYMIDITLGDYISKVSNMLNELFEDDDFPNYVSLDENIKETLLYCASQIPSPEDKAECKLAIITIK